MLLLETRRKDKQTRRSAVAASDGALIAHKPAVCGRDFPIACLRTASRASTASNRGGNVFFRFAPPCASLARCSVPAHFVCSALQPFGPSPFCKHLLPKNTRNDVHAVISDESLVLPILCQCSEPRMRVTHAHPRLFPLQFCAAYGAGVAAGTAGSMEGSETTAANRMELVSAS